MLPLTLCVCSSRLASGFPTLQLSAKNIVEDIIQTNRDVPKNWDGPHLPCSRECRGVPVGSINCTQAPARINCKADCWSIALLYSGVTSPVGLESKVALGCHADPFASSRRTSLCLRVIQPYEKLVGLAETCLGSDG